MPYYTKRQIYAIKQIFKIITPPAHAVPGDGWGGARDCVPRPVRVRFRPRRLGSRRWTRRTREVPNRGGPSRSRSSRRWRPGASHRSLWSRGIPRRGFCSCDLHVLTWGIPAQKRAGDAKLKSPRYFAKPKALIPKCIRTLCKIECYEIYKYIGGGTIRNLNSLVERILGSFNR